MVASDKSLSTKIAEGLYARVMGYAPRSAVSLTEFSQMSYRRYRHAKHLEKLDALLTSVSDFIASGGKQGIGRLIISMPPRHGKTQKISRIYPAWHLANYPDHRIMLVSYAADLAQKNSRWVRNTIKNEWFRDEFGVQLADDSQAVNAFNLARREGGMEALGIGGGATGKGAQLLIIDDPIKNRAEAESITYRNKVWDSFTDDLYTRLEPGGAVVVVMTRWHEDDLVGRLKEQSGEDWYELCLPAMAEDDDAIGRSPGEALWEERYTLERLKQLKSTLGVYAWSGLYQQHPTPTEGGLFKRAWFGVLRDIPPIVRRVRYWDLAMSDKESADYTVGVLLGEGQDGHVYVLDVSRVQYDWADVVPHMKSVILRDGITVMQGVEKKGYMSRAVKDLNRDPDLMRNNIMGYSVDESKTVRSMPLQSRFSEGVLHVTAGHWVTDYVEEFVLFPNGAHDDQVDATAGAFEMLATRQKAKFVEGNPFFK